MRKASIIQKKSECAVCGAVWGLEVHHCLFGPNRSNADTDGLWVQLCAEHHRGSSGVHGGNRELDLELKKIAEYKWLATYHKTLDDWMIRYGKNYLDEEDIEQLEEEK